MIKVKVPATSANLGVGFDCMGLAVSLYSNVYFEKSSQILEISGCPKEFQTSQNLIYQAFVKGCQYLGQSIPNVKITIENKIPMARGLGSSAFCIVAGLEGANEWFGHPLSKNDLLDLATQMEGHPDNVAPAIFGNLAVSFKNEDNSVQTSNFKIAKNLHFIALIPNYQVSTKKAREILPSNMSYKTVSYQVGHAVVLSKALEDGDFNLIKTSIVDKMHEPFRSQLIPDYQHAKQLCEENNGLMYISGSGSTMMGMTADQKDADEIFSAAKKDFPNWEVLRLNVDHHGVVVE